MGNHAYNIKDDVKGRIGGDTIISKEKSSVEIVGGQYKLSVDGKKMASNENERGIHIKTSKDYLLDVSGNLSQSTISGIVSIKSGSTLNMKSASAMTINSESTLSEIVSSNVTRTTGGTHTHSIQGEHTIDYNGDAHIRYDADYYRHIGKDTFFYNAAGVNHTQVDSPTRTSVVDVTSTTVNNL